MNLIVGIVGSGVMGTGISQLAATAGCNVTLHDSSSTALSGAVDSIGRSLASLVEKEKMTSASAHAIHGRIRPISTLAEIAGSDLIIEAIGENLDAKRSLFSKLESIVPTGCVLATNTSSFSISALSRNLKAPERLVGMHFFNPPGVMKLVEIVSGLSTDPAVANRVFEIAAAWGKKPVHVKSTPGFIVNRVARPFYAEGLRLLQENVASPAKLDAILRDAGGFRMGPFELIDLIGVDVNLAVTRSLYEAFFDEPRFRPSFLQQEMVDAGLLGRKSGHGFYEYGEGSKCTEATSEHLMPPPKRIAISRSSAIARSIASRFQLDFNPPDVAADDGRLFELDDAVVYLTNGRTASDFSLRTGIRNIVLIDLAFDYTSANRLAATKSASCIDAAFRTAVGFFQKAGFAVSFVDDAPGMVVMRIVAMLANEAFEAVFQGICSREALDLAMQNGVNYPTGPFGWIKRAGLETIYGVLENLGSYYSEDRYRISPAMRRERERVEVLKEYKTKVEGAGGTASVSVSGSPHQT
jgi:3-hydroxybutyryl-CoA dehydrogenase